jgi:ubiquinone/menaquinone biosynthesis C-methylase UbiE
VQVARDNYEISANLYDTLIEPFMKTLRQIGMTMCPHNEIIRVLDVCCGTGTFINLFEQRGCECFGIDLSRAMLNKARLRLKESAFLHEGDATNMPFRSSMFDLVLISMALHEIHSNSLHAIIQEVRRVLDPEGQILIIDYHPGPVTTAKGLLQKLMIQFIEFAAGRTHFTNYRDFIKSGGINSLYRANKVNMVEHKIVASGNLGLYMYKNESSNQIC